MLSISERRDSFCQSFSGEKQNAAISCAAAAAPATDCPLNLVMTKSTSGSNILFTFPLTFHGVSQNWFFQHYYTIVIISLKKILKLPVS